MRKQVFIAAAAIAALVACNEAMATVGGRSTSITVSNDFFQPSPDTVPTGDVTFTWSEPSDGHSVVWDGGPTALTSTAVLYSGSATFAVVSGTYTYHCSRHVGMRGTIVVE